MKYDFDELIDRSGTHAVKMEVRPRNTPEDAVMAWVADMDFAPPQAVLEALERRLQRRIFGYTMYHNPELKAAVTGWFRKRHDWTVQAEDIFFCPGVVTALSVLIMALSDPGDGIIIQPPVYHPFSSQIEGNDRVVMNNPLINEGGSYTMDLAGLEKLFAQPKVKGMILCNPHNPVGRVWREEELKAVVALAKAHGKWIISDEIHMDLTRPGVAHIPLLRLAPEYAQGIISCTSPTKTFNLAGLAISNIIIPNGDVKEKWNDIMSTRLHLGMVNPFGLEACIAAYTEGDEWLDQLRDYIDANFQAVADFCQEQLPQARLTPAEATYLAWLDLRGYTDDDARLADSLHAAGVVFNQGGQFGEEGRCFVRINLAAPRARVALMLERLKQAMDTLGS